MREAVTNCTELVVILDRSGSMQLTRTDHEGGLRSFVRDQRGIAGRVLLTFVRFDSRDPFELVMDGADIQAVNEEHLTLIPRGGTPLLDAVGRTLVHVRSRLAHAADKPGQVVVMIITDGQENASREFTVAQIKAQIAEVEAEGWKVLYLGANVNEFAEAAVLNISADNALGYRAGHKGVANMYASVSHNVGTARGMSAAGAAPDEVLRSYSFTKEQRAASKTEDDAT